MTTITLPSTLTEDEVKALNNNLSKDYLEVCGVKHDDKYIALGAGYASCMFVIPPELDNPNIKIWHTHPIDEPPSDTDISVTCQTDLAMEVITPNHKYIISCTDHDQTFK